MSGHSKWSTIKRKKGAEDAKRAKVFTRLGRDIMVAAREGGGDENANPKLKLAIAKARSANMPKENIERAKKKGTGEIAGGEVVEMLYEGYGPDGVAYIVEILTDNRNRALAEIKHAFSKHAGSLATNGAVMWQFDQKGFITLKGEADFDDVFLQAAEAGAEDVVDEDGVMTVYTARDDYATVEQALANAGYDFEDSELRWFPQNEIEVPKGKALQNMRLMEQLEEADDVQTVSSNLNITDEVLAAFEA
ncbi:MAG: YebC/PmpR family DNA-binding transcriptional regulator [Chloroflexota bacterium]|nr:YebC/PmpR family DNA-binding transcriptional regulator [Chloroflexota bacterium]MDE2909434.1 YebC/PmpR family DNA-binding transcriptional regulator [Chloroflexota bacterium]